MAELLSESTSSAEQAFEGLKSILFTAFFLMLESSKPCTQEAGLHLWYTVTFNKGDKPLTKSAVSLSELEGSPIGGIYSKEDTP